MITNREIKSLKKLLKSSQFICHPTELIAYEEDGTQERNTPDLVVFPETARDVINTVQWATARNYPIVGRGAGTGLSGGSVAIKGGVVISFSRMHRLLDLDTDGRSVIVEPGITNQALDIAVKSRGFYYPPDPSSGRTCTLGGNVAENAGGPHCFKYGVTSNYITGLEVILSDGKLVRLGGLAYDYPEYDFVGVLTGSEGTLGLVTKVFARLILNPPGVKTLMASFDSVEIAGRAVSAIIAAGLMPATLEMMDQQIIRVVEDSLHIGLPVDSGAMLIIDIDGVTDGLDQQINRITDVLRNHNVDKLIVARTAEERERLWYGRKSIGGALAKLAPAWFNLDGTVPRSHLAGTLETIKKICNDLNLMVCFVFHAGDGNLHPVIPYFPKDQEQVERAWLACERIMQVVVDRGGSITGEHGVGSEKKKFMKLMFDNAMLSAFQDIKNIFDPQNCMNPGKALPDQPPVWQKPAVNIKIETGLAAPRTSSDVASILSYCTEKRRQVQVSNRTSQNSDIFNLTTDNLKGIREYAPADLYITVGAGTRLKDIEIFLAPENKQVALDSPWEDATIGGIVASNFNSPRRMRYGSIRDQVLCLTAVLPDGRILTAGRPLVKNVAGYDLFKLFIGSQGTLGVITEISLKLWPLPAEMKTFLLPVDNLKTGIDCGLKFLGCARSAASILLHKHNEQSEHFSTGFVLAYSLEGDKADTEEELNQIQTLGMELSKVPGVIVDGSLGIEDWKKIIGKNTNLNLARIGIPVKFLSAFISEVTEILAEHSFVIDISNGLIYVGYSVTVDNDGEIFLTALQKQAESYDGYLTADQYSSIAVKTKKSAMYIPDSLGLMGAIKNKWDPSGILPFAPFQN